MRDTEQSQPPHGWLEPTVIQKIVRGNFGQLRLCYEVGLNRYWRLNGRVVTKFVIGTSGAVARAEDAGSDMPDAQVVQCVVQGFRGMRFPPPDGGPVTVVYPIAFNYEL